ncbi:ribosome production factor 1 [Pocillopora verrucosa]|uniref:ribosome production factor 1 n=1 Tax=Pocillopora verrucosa TaxID=203993 RepID=UPI0033425FF5
MATREGNEVDFSQIKNKQRRSSLYQKEKLKKAKEKRDRKRKRKQEESQEEGEPKPKQVPRTIDNTRVADETIVEPQDEEVLNDEETDEFAAYFRCEVVPKVLITSSDRSKVKTVQFMKELQHIIPNSEVRVRKGIDLKKIIPQAKEKGFTALVVVNEDKKMPNGIVISHLPDGPTAHFKLTSVKLGRTIKNHGRKTSHRPEVILNNFSTRLGHSVARLLAALFPHDPQFQGRQCVTFHNQRDFIFFRHHRYIFKNQKKAGLQELGPRFTLKLRSLQRGTFDSKFGEYEWIHKRKEMDTSRKKFFL